MTHRQTGMHPYTHVYVLILHHLSPQINVIYYIILTPKYYYNTMDPLINKQTHSHNTHTYTHTPDAEITQRSIGLGDDFLVMASDGMWDVLTNAVVSAVSSSSLKYEHNITSQAYCWFTSVGS